MLEQLKKALSTGVGLALKTWDEVEELGKELIKKAKLPEKEGANFLQGLKKSYEQTQKKIEIQVNQLVKDVLKKAEVATSEDVKDLKREIRKLKKELKAAKAVKTKSTRTKTQSVGKTKTKKSAG
jgi:polyhydroxyalkanoate synthesis regulator phasin